MIKDNKTNTKTKLLKQILHFHYMYQIGQPEITDREYDSIVKYYRDNFDSQFVIQHTSEFQTMDTVYDLKTLKVQIERINKTFENAIWACEIKLDGISCIVIYNDFKLVKVLTRGEEKNIDITKNFLLYVDCPITIGEEQLEVKGEVVIKRNKFVGFQSKYSNSRNMICAMLFNLHSVYEEKILDFIPFHIQNSRHNFETHTESMTWLKKTGFEIVKKVEFEYYNTDDRKLADNLNSILEESEYYADGVVLKLDNLHQRKFIAHFYKSVKWMFSVKPRSTVYVTTIKSIFFNITRFGVLHPVCKIDPVIIDERTITKINLHNLTFIEENKIGVESVVEFELRSGLIPYIVKNITFQPFTIPELCEYCNTKTIKTKLDIVCNNTECEGVITQQILYSLQTLGIKSLGESNVKKIVSKGCKSFIKFLCLDLFSLVQLLSSEKIAKTVFNNIQKQRSKIDGHSILASLGIRGLAEKTTKKLKSFSNLTQLFNVIKNNSLEIEKIKKLIGECITNSLISFVKNNQILIDEILLSNLNLSLN